MKKIAIIARELSMGGTEKSLINLLKVINNRYDITLYLLQKKGVFTNSLPDNIKVKEIFDSKDMKYFYSLSNNKYDIFTKVNVILWKALSKFNKNLFFKLVSNKAHKDQECYDWCIDYHGYGYYGSYYAIKYINAKHKAIFIHDEGIEWAKTINKTFVKFDYYFCVSKSCMNIVKNDFNIDCSKIMLCRNLIDKESIYSLSKEKQKYLFESNTTNLLTIGRVEYQKGYDLLVKIGKQLVKNNIQYHWYIIGDGKLKESIQQLIKDNKLEDYISLLGLIENPYPYINNCDIYVQTSRHEGYGIAIAEARVLNKPIIATNLDCVKEQITDGYNGILCDFDVNSFANKIIELINNKEKNNILINNLKKENKDDNYDFINIIGE